MSENFLLLGIDGGATKVSGWNVLVNETEQTFSLGELNAEKSYREIPGFLADYKPADLPTQLKQREENSYTLSLDEQQQGTVYVEACAQVIERLAELSGRKTILIGLGMPGLKTADRRGINALNNGPRMIGYCETLEKRLALKNIQLLSPIDHIGSDADYCGIGENYSAEGMFRGVTDAYYLGGGTGVADAMKLDGKLLPFDLAKEWIAKCWEMKSADGRSLERFASAGGIQAIYAEIAKADLADLNARQIFPLQIAELAAQGDTAAQAAFRLVAENIALLLFERITSLFAGWQGLFGFVNPNRANPSATHSFKGKVFERIIIGQRLGQLYDSPAGQKVLKQPVLENLSELLAKSDALDPSAKAHYSCIGEIIVTSQLREAPAIGAGIDAYLTYRR